MFEGKKYNVQLNVQVTLEERDKSKFYRTNALQTSFKNKNHLPIFEIIHSELRNARMRIKSKSYPLPPPFPYRLVMKKSVALIKLRPSPALTSSSHSPNLMVMKKISYFDEIIILLPTPPAPSGSYFIFQSKTVTIVIHLIDSDVGLDIYFHKN